MSVFRTYELRIYNGFVREMIDKGEANVTGFSDDWADARYIEVTATSLAAAVRVAHRDYPEEAGFVITDAIALPEEA